MVAYGEYDKGTGMVYWSTALRNYRFIAFLQRSDWTEFVSKFWSTRPCLGTEMKQGQSDRPLTSGSERK